MRYQIIYKQQVFTDAMWDTFEEVMETFNDYLENDRLDNRFLSIEIQLDRDIKRQNGQRDTRGTLKELAEDYMDKEYKEAMRKIEDIQRIIGC